MTPSLCTKVGEVEYRHSPTVGDYVLEIELLNPDSTRSELYRFVSDTGRLHHWVGADDVYRQGTDSAFDDVYRRLERSGFLSGQHTDWRIQHGMKALVNYALGLRAAERRAAEPSSIDAAVHTNYRPSMASERARRRTAVNECRAALGLPRY